MTDGDLLVWAGHLFANISTQDSSWLVTRLGDLHPGLAPVYAHLLGWTLAILSFVLLVVSRGVLLRLVHRHLVRALPWDEQAIAVIDPPLTLLGPCLGLLLAASFFPHHNPLDYWLTGLGVSLFLAMLFMLVANAMPLVFEILTRDSTSTARTTGAWLAKIMKGLVLILGCIAILESWNIAVAPILAGFGLVGVAVALGAQDLFKNLISGALIIAERRFAEGDWIMMEGGVEGTVESIGFRSTRIVTFDMVPVQVPNKTLSEAPLSNFSSRPHRRVYWNIGLEYRTSAEQLRGIRRDIEQWIVEHPAFVSDGRASLVVNVSAFNDSSIDLMVYCFTETADWVAYMDLREELLLWIKEVVEERHGAGFAFPSRSIYMESGGPTLMRPPEQDGSAQKGS